MSEAATSGGDREIEETVTAASTEDAWTQLISRADIDKAVAAAQPTSGDAGLPWSYEDTWPLSERQLRHLSFELLLLCPPGELEAEDDPQDEAPQGEASASELPTLSSLSEAQRVVLAEGLSAQLAKCVRGPEQPDGELPSLVRLAAGLEDFAEEEAGAAGGEEALEARLARLLGAVGPAAERAAAAAEQWMEEQAAKGEAAWAELARKLGVQPEPEPGPEAEAEPSARAPVVAPPRRRAGGEVARGRGDALLEHVRLQLGVARGAAARLAVLVRAGTCPPEPGWHRLPGAPRHATPAPAAALFGDIGLFVPYRLVLLATLGPSHFGSHAEYCDFAERQLAAFTCGLLAAIREAPAQHRWWLRLDAAQQEQALSRAELEATLYLPRSPCISIYLPCISPISRARSSRRRSCQP